MKEKLQRYDISIDMSASNQRLDRFCRKLYKSQEDISLSMIYQWIRSGVICVNGHKSKESYRVGYQDIVTTPIIQKFHTTASKKDQQPKKNYDIQQITKQILFEDQDRLVRNKIPGIAIHTNKDNIDSTSMDGWMTEYLGNTHTHATFRPSFCYRLDKDTSGVLIAAKNFHALQRLNQQIRDRLVQKEYHCVVIGKHPGYLEHTGSLHKVVDKRFQRGKMVIHEDGLESKTESRCLKNIYIEGIGDISYLKVKIHTGRMHQIRAHLASAGHAILGDIVYGIPSYNRKFFKKYTVTYFLLHAHIYTFSDSNGNTQSFTAPLPQIFLDITR